MNFTTHNITYPWSMGQFTQTNKRVIRKSISYVLHAQLCKSQIDLRKFKSQIDLHKLPNAKHIFVSCELTLTSIVLNFKYSSTYFRCKTKPRSCRLWEYRVSPKLKGWAWNLQTKIIHLTDIFYNVWKNLWRMCVCMKKDYDLCHLLLRSKIQSA